MNQRSPYMTMRELVDFVRLEGTKHPMVNAWKWAKRHGVPMVGHGRALVLRDAVIEALEDAGKARARRRLQRKVSA